MQLIAKVVEEFQKKAPDCYCPMCRKNRWGIPSNSVSMLTLNDLSSVMKKEDIGVLPITCQHCGNMQFLNINFYMMGSEPAKDPASSPDNSAKTDDRTEDQPQTQ